MKKIIPLIITCYLASTVIFAQDAKVKDLQASANKPIKSAEKDGWTRDGIFSINVNQGTLSNWAAGGEQNTLGVNALFNYRVNYRKGKNTWDNLFDLALGFQNATSFGHYRKTDDHLDITSKYGRQISKNWYAGFLVNFNSQALTGYDYTTTPNVNTNSNRSKNLLTSSGGSLASIVTKPLSHSHASNKSTTTSSNNTV